MFHDASRGVGQRVRLRVAILNGCHPAHYTKTADIVNVHHFHAVKREVFKINPIFAVGVTLQVERASLGQFGFRYRQDIS